MKMFLAVMMLTGLGLTLGACEDTSVHRVESNKRNWDGSTTHQETTIRENGNGSVTVDKESSRTR